MKGIDLTYLHDLKYCVNSLVVNFEFYIRARTQWVQNVSEETNPKNLSVDTTSTRPNLNLTTNLAVIWCWSSIEGRLLFVKNIIGRKRKLFPLRDTTIRLNENETKRTLTFSPSKKSKKKSYNRYRYFWLSVLPFWKEFIRNGGHVELGRFFFGIGSDNEKWMKWDREYLKVLLKIRKLNFFISELGSYSYSNHFFRDS